MQHLTGLFQNYPYLGYIGSAPAILTGLLTKVEIATGVVGFFAITVGLLVGILTGAVQWQNYRRNQREEELAQKIIDRKK